MTRNISDRLHESYSDDANHVWRSLNISGKSMSPFQIAAHLGMTPRAVKCTLDYLTRDGLAERTVNGAWIGLPGIVCDDE
jgi:predicted ArsR family transcriptional regulator